MCKLSSFTSNMCTKVSSEFGPAVPWGGPYGTINAAAGHHLSEGRWIRNRGYMDGLARFWIGSQVRTSKYFSILFQKNNYGHLMHFKRLTMLVLMVNTSN